VKVGGSETFIRGLSLALAARGHQVTVLTKRDEGVPYQGIYRVDGAKMSLEEMQTQSPHVETLAFEPLGRGPMRTNGTLSRFMGHFGWDAVVLFGQNVWVTDEIWRDVGWWRKIASHATVAYIPVGFPRDGARRFLYDRVVQRHLLEESDVAVALTEPEMADIRRIAKPQRLVRIPAGVDCARFRGERDVGLRSKLGLGEGPLLLNVGGDYANKRLRLAIAGTAAFNEDADVAATLVMVGPGTENLNGVGPTRGLGLLPESDVAAMYRECALLLHTSSFEGFGIVFLEALASGIPFVSTDVGAARELASQFGGEIIRRATSESVAYHLLREADAWHSAEELRSVALMYDWSSVSVDVEDALGLT